MMFVLKFENEKYAIIHTLALVIFQIFQVYESSDSEVNENKYGQLREISGYCKFSIFTWIQTLKFSTFGSYIAIALSNNIQLSN